MNGSSGETIDFLRAEDRSLSPSQESPYSSSSDEEDEEQEVNTVVNLPMNFEEDDNEERGVRYGQQKYYQTQDYSLALDKKQGFFQRLVSFRHPVSYAILLIGVLVIGLWIGTLTSVSQQKQALANTSDEKLQHHKPELPAFGNFNSSAPHVTFGELYRFNPEHKSYSWISHPKGEDGWYLDDRLESYLKMVNAQTGQSEFLVKAEDLWKDGERKSYSRAIPSADLKYVLFEYESRQIWRHSYTAKYFVYDIAGKRRFPLRSADPDAEIQYVAWSPVGHRLFFVQNNDLYVTDLEKEIRVTADGSETVFNGIPDWIYEEEVFAGRVTTWWSPDAVSLVFLRMDEARVPTYAFPMYHTENTSDPYPESVQIRYPKPGHANPTVSAHLFTPDFSGSNTSVSIVFPLTKPISDDNIFTMVKWATDSSKTCFVRIMSRVQDYAALYLINIDAIDKDTHTLNAKLVREEDHREEAGGDGGWIEINTSLTFVRADPSLGITQDGYLDLVVFEDYLHLAFFSSLDTSTTSTILTKGSFNVNPESIQYDSANGIVYFMSSEEASTSWNLYSAKIDGSDKRLLSGSAIAITDAENYSDWSDVSFDTIGSYSVSFSSKLGVYLLSYEGPGVPWSLLVTPQKDLKPKTTIIEGNRKLHSTIDDYQMPTRVFSTIQVNGEDLNMYAIYPPGFDPSAIPSDYSGPTYPALFRVYGGPNSQMVQQSFSVDWHSALASQQDNPFIVYVVDGRGTANKGRKFMISVLKSLGKHEVEDQIAAAKIISQLPYIDKDRIALWGWSFGGFMASKVAEADSGVFAATMAVAPVINWFYYDSIYTERYMKLPQDNPFGYQESAVSRTDGFKNMKHFLLCHGTGDDNVHFQNSMLLIDELIRGKVRNYDFRAFPDSNHSISRENANSEVFTTLQLFLNTYLPRPSHNL